MVNGRDYWDGEWNSQSIDEYQSYIEFHLRANPWFISIFQNQGIKNVCDAACGFGAYSAMLSTNGFQVSGFYISSSAVCITKTLLDRNQLTFVEYHICDICKINFEDERFDAVVAHAVIDHVTLESAKTAISELSRITKNGGLVYLSFDPLEQDDILEPHNVLNDGSYFYTEGSRKGLLFRYYQAQEIKALVQDCHVLEWQCSRRGERSIVLVK